MKRNYMHSEQHEHYDSKYLDHGDRSSKKPAMITEGVAFCKHIQYSAQTFEYKCATQFYALSDTISSVILSLLKI